MHLFSIVIVCATLTLKDAITIALQNNQSILFPSLINYRNAKLEYQIHRGMYYPQLRFSSWSEDDLKRYKSLLSLNEKLIPYIGTDVEFNFSINPINASEGSVGVRLAQPLSPQRVLSSYFAEKSVKYTLDMAEIQKNVAMQDLILEVVNSYFGLARIISGIKRAEESIKNTESLIEVMKVKVEGGLIAPSELSNIYLQKNLEVANYEELIENLRTAKEEFFRLLGIEMDDSLRLEEDVFLNIEEDLNFETCWTVALKKNPELKLIEIQMKQVENNLKAQKLFFFPDIVFSLNYNRSFGSSSETSAPQKSLSFEWPLFTGGVLRNRKKQAEENYKLALFNYEEFKHRLRKEIKDVLFRIQLAKKKFKLYEASRALAVDALKVAEIKYRSGAISYQEWYFNFQRFVEMEENYANLKTELFLLYARLLRLMGELTPERILK